MASIVEGIAKDLKNIPKTIKSKTKSMEPKKVILKVLPYVIFGYVADKFAYGYRVTPGNAALNRLMDSLSNNTAFMNPLPSFNPMDLLIGAAVGIGMRVVVYFKAKNAKKFRHGEEYGSARWGTPKDIEPYMDKEDFENNILLTSTERLQMNGRPSSPKFARNKNVLIIGGSGSGKTRFFVKPNLMQMHSSYVVTDPKGTVLLEVGKMLQKNGYRIKVLNTINFAKSCHYNPFAYIRSEKDILKLVNTIIVNTKGEGAQATEDFWVKAEKLYYTALIAYIWYEAPPEEQNFSMLIDLIDASEAREDDGAYYHVSPWALCWDDEKYYLIGYDNDENKIKHFRVDKMTNTDIVNEKRLGKAEFSQIKMTEYTNRLFGMFEGEPETVKLLCENQVANIMFDRFGTDVPVVKVDAEHFEINVKVSVSKLFLGWIMALPGVKIIAPDATVEAMKAEITRLQELYF